jgi:hypothetical protein
MKLPEELSRLKKLGAAEETLDIDDISFVLRSITGKEYLDAVATTSTIPDDNTRFEMTKQKILETSIKTVNGVAVDNTELIRYLVTECNPNVIEALFGKYMIVANKAAKQVHDKIDRGFEIADTNISSAFMGSARSAETTNPVNLDEGNATQ